MSSKAGPKNYTVYVTDISGAAISGASTGWLITGRVNTEVITTGVVTEIGNGFYFANINAPNGTGFVKISNTNTTYIITPSYFIVDDNVKDTDDLYASQEVINSNVIAVKNIVSTFRINSQEAAGCFCLGPPGASQPPFITDRQVATVYPNIFNFAE
jgi:hypothetical protein